jgi:NSS family neurotransmitter:Na+ symporter
VVWVTVTVPWLILLIFVIRGITLPGASEGIRYYLTPNFAKLLEPQVWLAAYVQIFFTLSIGWGVMIAYASFLPKDSDIVKNAYIISLANCLTSFVGGFAVFSALGYYAQNLGVPVSDVVKSGPHLAFVTYPTIILMLPFARELFGALFFLMLLTLAIDSGFSFVEGTAAGFIDKFKFSRLKTNSTLICVAFVIGLLFATHAGYYWLDIVDYFLNSTLLVVVGILECVVIGWVYGSVKLRDYANSVSDWKAGKWWDFVIKFLTPIILLVTLLSALIERLKSSYEGYPRWAEFSGGWLVAIVLIVLAFLLSAAKGKEESE